MIRKARREDFDFFYSIKCEDDNLYWCGYRERPVRENLLAFWNKYIPNDKESTPDAIDETCGDCLRGGMREIYIVEEENRAVGYLYIDYSEDAQAELSIGISNAESGNGYGTKAVKEAAAYLHTVKLSATAYIREDNDKSQALFKRAGLVRTDEYREMMLPCGENQKVVKLYRWKSEYRP